MPPSSLIFWFFLANVRSYLIVDFFFCSGWQRRSGHQKYSFNIQSYLAECRNLFDWRPKVGVQVVHGCWVVRCSWAKEDDRWGVEIFCTKYSTKMEKFRLRYDMKLYRYARWSKWSKYQMKCHQNDQNEELECHDSWRRLEWCMLNNFFVQLICE